jgi:hypothetical protein
VDSTHAEFAEVTLAAELRAFVAEVFCDRA